LGATDILTGLNTGMIDALPTTPLAALSLQWFRHTPYMQDFGVAPLIGATVIHKRLWDRLSQAQRNVMRAAAVDAEATLRREVPDQDKRAVAAMTSRGLEVVKVPAEHQAAWQSLAERFAEDMRKHSVAKDLIAAIGRARDAYRAKAAAGGAGGR
jgi:TRAP-type C4-dicarboxylate transport system substrate-binding protein